MQHTDFQGGEAPSFAMSAVLPDDSETTLPDADQDNKRNETDDFRTWNWGEAATAIGINESTLRKVWWEDALEPAFRHCPISLRVVARTVKKSGRQLEEFTAFGLQVLQAYKTAKGTNDRTAERFLAEAKASYPAVEEPTHSTSEQQPKQSLKVSVESGNHQIVLAAPVLAQTYTLEGLRKGESLQFEDPLAIAAQFLVIADQVQAAMESDIDQREQKLVETRQAKDAVAAKAQELKLEQRFYKARAHFIDTAQTHETQSLQETLSTLQALGKPPEPNPFTTGD
ncbi:hypothetical protein [Stenomitos frigidus]|uniref:Uncharacterized protein n=1 Tax=Stenomitos frigidus ULC18 TaxID=2107698 RepID=A0A2T1EML9_9CYAN|nr:hypothetical protein [Stenomitos frigidus]PSB33928.1 hypothetical protein C7B82_03435 [Stenomitos frigidus ULC18]